MLRAREEAVRYIQLCLEHQVAFFDYFKRYRREGCTEFLKKRFDGEQIRILASRELGDMIEEFTCKGIDCKLLVRYKGLCDSFEPDSKNQDTLYGHLVDTCGIEYINKTKEILTGGREICEYTAQDRRVCKRIMDFYYKTLITEIHQDHWTNMLDVHWVIHIFTRGYSLYTKCNVSRKRWDNGHGAPEYCLYEMSTDGGICDDIFKNDALVQTYGAVRESIRKYVNLACSLCVLLEKFFGTKVRPSQSIESIENFMWLKPIGLKLLCNEIQVLKYVSVSEEYASFKKVTDALEGIFTYVDALYRKNMQTEYF